MTETGIEGRMFLAGRWTEGRGDTVAASSLKRAFTFIDDLRVGNVVVNDTTDYWEAMEPFGGASGTRAGWGRVGGKYGLMDMTDLHSAVIFRNTRD